MKLDKSRRYLILALIMGLLLALWLQLPRLINPDIFPPDFLNFYWVHTYQNPQLFPTVPTVDTSFQRGSFLYALLLQGGSYIMDPGFLSKLLVFPLIGLVVFFSYRIALPFTGPGTALALSLFLAVVDLAGPTDWTTAAGLQRSFQLPMLLALVYFLMQQRFAIGAALVAMGGLLYLPLLPVAALFYGLTLVDLAADAKWKVKIRWRPLLYLAVAVAVVMVVIWPLFATRLAPAQTGGAAAQEAQHILSDPRYSAEGRYPLFRDFPLVGRAGLFGTWNIASVFILLCILGAIVSIVRRRPIRPLPPILIKLLAAGLMAFVLSWLAILLTSSLLLYLPNRHTRVVLLLGILFYVFFNVEESLQTIVDWIQTNRRQVSRLLTGVVLAAGAVALFLPTIQREWYERLPWLATARWLMLALTLVLALLLPLYARKEPAVEEGEQTAADGSRKQRGRWLLGMGLLLLAPLYFAATPRDYYEPTAEEKELYTYLGSLPVDTMIAGDPCSLDFVPFYARRAVLLTCSRPGSNIIDPLDAYYAEDRGHLLQFCRQYDVDYLVVNKESFQPQVIADGSYFFEPYTSRLHDRISSRSRYYLEAIPPEAWLFEGAGRYVVPCGRELPRLNGG